MASMSGTFACWTVVPLPGNGWLVLGILLHQRHFNDEAEPPTLPELLLRFIDDKDGGECSLLRPSASVNAVGCFTSFG